MVPDKLSSPLKDAKWIWPADCPYMRNTFAQFRRDVELKQRPGKAPVWITADQSYQLWVNGEYVGRGPARGFQHKWSYDEYDVARFLREGKNWISVLVFNGGISTFGYLHEYYAGLLFAAKFGRVKVVSDRAWWSRVSPGYRADTLRMSVQTNLQEQFDARLDDGDWITAKAGVRGWPRMGKESGGGPTTTERAYGSQPWYSLEERGIPNLTSDCVAYERAVSATSGKCAAGYDDTPNVAVPVKVESESLDWGESLPEVKRAGGWNEIEIGKSGKGKLRAVVLDMGKPVVGTLRVEVSGCEGGEMIDFHGSEVVTDDGGPWVPGAAGKQPSMGFAWRLVLKAKRTRHEFHQMIGHRFLAVIVRDTQGPVKIRLSLRETRYPLEVRGKFNCSDETLNDIHRICIRTQEVCMLDGYVDTPWREQAQWWGDARVQGGNTFHLADDARLFARGVRILARQSVPNGLTYGHAPTNSHGCVLPDFTMIWVLTLWDYYWQTGKVDLVEQQWERALDAMEYFTGEGVGENGLLRYDERYWLFLDWTEIHKKGTPTLLNLWYVAMLHALIELAGLISREDDARYLRALRKNQVGLVMEYLWDDKAQMFRDGLTEQGKAVGVHSIHNQTLAMMAGLKKEAWGVMVEKKLWPYLKDKKVSGALPSSYWVGYVYGVMNRLGYGADVVRHIREHYGPMVVTGGTRENWDSGTYSHAWAAHPIQHLAGSLGGVRQSEVGWKRVDFSPVIDMEEVSRVELVVPTGYGDIVSTWKRTTGGKVDVKLKLPRGVKADVKLNGVKQEGVEGISKWRIEI